MAIWYMNGNTFQKMMIPNEKPESVLNAKYVMVSSRIRTSKTKEFRKQIINANMSLFPEHQILADLGALDGEWFENEYRKQLRAHRGFLANLVNNAVKNNVTFIFICSKSEWKVGSGRNNYMQIIADYVYEEFGYPMWDYKKYKLGKEKPVSYNKDEVIHRCKKIIKDDRINYLNKKMKTRKGRQELLKELSDKEMKQLLKSVDLYTKGMGRKEMKHLLKDYVLI